MKLFSLIIALILISCLNGAGIGIIGGGIAPECVCKPKVRPLCCV